MSNAECQKLFDEVDEIACEMFADLGEVRPMAFIVTPERKIAVELRWNDAREKELAITFLKMTMQRLGAQRYGLITEAWMTKPAIGDVYVPPSQSDARREVITVQIEDPIEGMMFGTREILTEAVNGEVVRTLDKLEVFPMSEGGEIKGNLANMLGGEG